MSTVFDKIFYEQLPTKTLPKSAHQLGQYIYVMLTPEDNRPGSILSLTDRVPPS